MTMQIHDVSLEVLRTLTLVRHIGADEAPARKRLRKICDTAQRQGLLLDPSPSSRTWAYLLVSMSPAYL